VKNNEEEIGKDRNVEDITQAWAMDPKREKETNIQRRGSPCKGGKGREITRGRLKEKDVARVDYQTTLGEKRREGRTESLDRHGSCFLAGYLDTEVGRGKGQ